MPGLGTWRRSTWKYWAGVVGFTTCMLTWSPSTLSTGPSHIWPGLVSHHSLTPITTHAAENAWWVGVLGVYWGKQ